MTSTLRKISTTAVLALSLASCASNKGGYKTEADVERRVLRMTREEVLVDLGPPTKQAALEGGRESWRYESQVSGLTGGECTLSLVVDTKRVVQAKLSANDRSWVAYPLGSCTKIIQTLR